MSTVVSPPQAWAIPSARGVRRLDPRRRIRSAFGGSTTIETRELRIAGGAMLGIAAVRPSIPFEFVPPCPLRALTGIPCPMCGMTRGVAALVHGDLGRALFLNPASLLAVALAVVLLVQWRTKRVVIPVWVLATAMGLMWTWQLFKYATGRAL